jgi:hypothetical protein
MGDPRVHELLASLRALQLMETRRPSFQFCYLVAIANVQSEVCAGAALARARAAAASLLLAAAPAAAALFSAARAVSDALLSRAGWAPPPRAEGSAAGEGGCAAVDAAAGLELQVRELQAQLSLLKSAGMPEAAAAAAAAPPPPPQAAPSRAAKAGAAPAAAPRGGAARGPSAAPPAPSPPPTHVGAVTAMRRGAAAPFTEAHI